MLAERLHVPYWERASRLALLVAKNFVLSFLPTPVIWAGILNMIVSIIESSIPSCAKNDHKCYQHRLPTFER